MVHLGNNKKFDEEDDINSADLSETAQANSISVSKGSRFKELR